MVESGQPDPSQPVAEIGFSNPDLPRLGVEVVDFALLSSRSSPQLLARVHRTDFHQVILITAGRGVAMVDFTDHACPPGTLLQVSPGRVLRLPRPADPADANAAVGALMVLFTPAFPPRLNAARTLLSPFGPAVWHLEPEQLAQLVQAIGQLADEYARAVREPGNAVTIELLRHLLAALILRIVGLPGPDGVQAGMPSGDDELFIRFQHELERSFATTRGAAYYAARIGYAPRTLNRACLAATGRTGKALIDARVALEAKRLLAHTELPVAAIGHRLGFTEPTNFGKFFTREAGTSPGAFRASQLPETRDGRPGNDVGP